MKKNKFFIILLLAICAVLMLSLCACKDDSIADLTSSFVNVQQSVQSEQSSTIEASNDTADKKTSSSDKILQGIELEEDIFDNGDAQSGVSDGTVSDVITNNDSSNADSNASENASSDGDNSDSDASEGSESSLDGTIKLPVDRFD